MKTALGIYTNDPEAVDAVAKSKARVVLLFEGAISLAPAIKATCPEILIIGRWWFDPVQYVPLDLAEAYRKGREVADALDIPAQPQIDAWQSYNEYINSIKSTEHWLAYNQFELGFTHRVHELGKKSVIGNIPVGNGTVFQLLLMRESLAEADFFAYHGYTSPDNRTVDDYCFGRFKSWVEEYQRQGLRFPPVILTEIGTWYPFKHCENYRENQCIEADLPPILIAMSMEMQALDYVVGGCIFCWGDCGGWTGFDISENGDEYIELLAELNKESAMGAIEQDPEGYKAWEAAGGIENNFRRHILAINKTLPVSWDDVKLAVSESEAAAMQAKLILARYVPLA